MKNCLTVLVFVISLFFCLNLLFSVLVLLGLWGPFCLLAWLCRSSGVCVVSLFLLVVVFVWRIILGFVFGV